MLVRAGEAFHAMHGPLHARSLLARRALGALWRRWHRLDEAIAHLDSLLAFLESQPEADRLQVARTLIELGLAHQSRGDLDRAQTALEQARDIYAAQYGAEHTFTNRARGLLARVASDRGDVAEAASSFEHLAAETLRQRGDRHPISAWMLQQLGALQAKQGRLAEAEASLLQAGAIYEALVDGPSLPRARNLLALGKLRRLQGRPDEAAQLTAQALAIFEALLPAEHPELAEARADDGVSSG